MREQNSGTNPSEREARRPSEEEIKAADSELWIEEFDELIFQPQEIVPNKARADHPASDLHDEIARDLPPGKVSRRAS